MGQESLNVNTEKLTNTHFKRIEWFECVTIKPDNNSIVVTERGWRLPVMGGGLCAIVRFSSGAITAFASDFTTGGWQTRILHVYTQRFRASRVLQYTLEHLETRRQNDISLNTSTFQVYSSGILTYWYPTGKRLCLQSESSVSIPKQSMVMEPSTTESTSAFTRARQSLFAGRKVEESTYRSSCGPFPAPALPATFF